MRIAEKSRIWKSVTGEESTDFNLWKLVEKNRKELADCENYPILDSLESSWQVLSNFYDGIIERADKDKVAGSPFSALFYYIEMGFYPPPEILLALLDGLIIHEASLGEWSLEEIFFGPPKKKSGGYARQRSAWLKRIHLSIELTRLMNEGNTKARAAELLSEKLGGAIEPETLARTVGRLEIGLGRKNKTVINPRKQNRK